MEDGSYNGADEQGAGGQQQHGQEEEALAGQGGSEDSGFSVNRLLLPPRPPYAGPHIGYSGPYQQCTPFSAYPGPGLEGGGQRWPNYPPYPMPPPPPSYVPPSSPLAYPTEPPTTPTHHHHHHHHHSHHESSVVTSPVDMVPSPQPTCNVSNAGGLHLYHPANAGLFTLCQAAALQQENGAIYAPQVPPQHLSLQMVTPAMTLSHPPPPYIQYYHQNQHQQHHQQQPPLTPFTDAPSLQTSPTSPHPHTYQPNVQLPPPPPHTPDIAMRGVSEQSSQHSPAFTWYRSRMPSSDGMQEQQQQQPAGISGGGGGGGGLGSEHQLSRRTPFGSNGTQPPPDLAYSVDHHHLTPHHQTETEVVLVLENGDRPGSSFSNHHLPPPTGPLPVAQDGPQQPAASYMLEHQLSSDDSTTHTDKDLVIDLSSGGSGATDEDQLSESALTLPPPPLPVTAAQVVAGEQKKSKRTRTAYSQIQQDLLELAFHVNPYPDGFYRQKVALDIGIPEDRVQVWFQNRRARGKKQSRTGSVSERSKYREHRLRLTLAGMASQGVVIQPVRQGSGNGAHPRKAVQSPGTQQLLQTTTSSHESVPTSNGTVEEQENTSTSTAMYTFPPPPPPPPPPPQDPPQSQSSSDPSLQRKFS